MDTGYAAAFAKGLAITMAVEIPVVRYLLARHFRQAGKEAARSPIVAAAFFANLATLPYLWFVYPEFLPTSGAVALGEATALVAEATLYALLLRSSWSAAFLASLTANAASVLAGLLLLPPAGG